MINIIIKMNKIMLSLILYILLKEGFVFFKKQYSF